MKPLITFLALLMLFMTCFSFAGDYQLYMHENNSLREAANECAEDAALCLDYEKYAEGKIVFDKDEAAKAANEYFEYFLKHISKTNVENYDISISFNDESDYTGEDPKVTVTLTLNTEDIFHNRFITVTSLVRSSTCELKIE